MAKAGTRYPRYVCPKCGREVAGSMRLYNDGGVRYVFLFSHYPSPASAGRCLQATAPLDAKVKS